MNRFVRISLFKLAILGSVPFSSASLYAQAAIPYDISNEVGTGGTIKIKFDRVGYKPVPIAFKKNLIVIDVLVNGHTARALIDTGSKFTLLNSNFQKTHNIVIPRQAKDVIIDNLNIKLRRTESLNVSIPNQGIVKLSPVSFDMSSLRNSLGENVDVIIGQDVMTNISTLIDLSNSLIYFAPSGSINIADDANMVSISKDFTFQVLVNDVKYKLLLDTGSNYHIVLFDKSKSAVVDKEPDSPVFRSIDAIGNISRGKMQHAQSVEIGKNKYQDNIVTTHRVENSYDGIIGMGFMSYNAVLIDPTVGKLMMVGPRH